MIGLDRDFTGVIQDSASRAVPMAIYTSSEIHPSVEKDAKVNGISRQFVRQIPVGADFSMPPDALAEAIATDRANGVTPALTVATLGTTGVAAIYLLRAIGDIYQREDVFLHVNAA